MNYNIDIVIHLLFYFFLYDLHPPDLDNFADRYEVDLGEREVDLGEREVDLMKREPVFIFIHDNVS